MLLPDVFICLEKASTFSEDSPEANRLKFDPFTQQFDKVRVFLEERGFWEEINLLLKSDDASTSDISINTSLDDSRLPFARLLIILLEKLYLILQEEKNNVADEYMLISLKNLAVLKKVMNFVVLTAISPFISQGVGIPLNKRSVFVKSWKRLDGDIFLRRSSLHRICDVLFSLSSSNEAVKIELCSKYLGDLICANEQLIELGDRSLVAIYDEFLSSVSSIDLVRELTVLSKERDPKCTIPSWFTSSIGERLSNALTSDNGLFTFLHCYTEMAGTSVWDNSHFLSKLARQLVLVPRKQKKMRYYERITTQFISIIVNRQFTENNSAPVRLFAIFVDELTKKDQLATSSLILDKLFRCWEGLSDRLSFAENVPWSPSMDLSIFVLSAWSDPKITPQALTQSKRCMAIIPVLMLILSSPIFSSDPLPFSSKLLKDHLNKILKSTLSRLENKADFLVNFMCDKRKDSPQLGEKESTLVQEVNEGSISTTYGRLQFVNARDNEEENLGKRIEAVVLFIESLPKSEATILLTECVCKCVEKWTSANENDSIEPNRFVLFEKEVDKEWTLLSSHMVIGVLFEQLGECDLDVTDARTAMSLAHVVKTVIRSVWENIEIADSERVSIDIAATPDHQTERIQEITHQNAKLAIGLAGGLVMAASLHPDMGFALTEICDEIRRFANVVERSSSVSEDILHCAQDARSLLKLFNPSDVQNGDAHVKGTQKVKKSITSVIPLMDELRVDLNDEMEAIRGQALIRLARLVRSKDQILKGHVDEWLWNRVVDLLQDTDSYVYLNAINVMAEIAYVDTIYLEKMVEKQREWREKEKEERARNAQQKATEESEKEKGRKVSENEYEEVVVDSTHLIMRGRLAEATGKVFRLLGDLAPSYLTRLIGVYLFDLNENEEIVRASALSAIADIVHACRGRGLDRHLDELLQAVDSIIRIDPSALVRRSAVHLVKECLRSASKDLLLVVGDRLRDLRRSLVHLWKWDKDYVVRLHAELCIEEIRVGLQEAILSEGSIQSRRINF